MSTRRFYQVRCWCGAVFVAAEAWTTAKCPCGKVITLYAAKA
jgi:hypothetical protein